MPDYDLLLLCDKVVMDEESFQRLVEEPALAYTGVAYTFKLLATEERIELVDFAGVLRSNAELLDRMNQHDIQTLDRWVGPLRESLAIWRQFWRDSTELILAHEEARHVRHTSPLRTVRFYPHETTHVFHGTNVPFVLSPTLEDYSEVEEQSRLVEEALRSSANRRRRKHREALRWALRSYLGYVNANLILSNALDVGFHDWLDFTPFYSAKFLTVGKGADPMQEKRRQVEKLFTVSFPDLAIEDPRSLLKALDDRRIQDLRQLVSDAVEGKVQFDAGFANAILREVFRVERSAKKWRDIIGYLTLPIGLIPYVGTPVEKAVSHIVGTAADKKMQREHRWFYMLSDIAEAAESPTE